MEQALIRVNDNIIQTKLHIGWGPSVYTRYMLLGTWQIVQLSLFVSLLNTSSTLEVIFRQWSWLYEIWRKPGHNALLYHERWQGFVYAQSSTNGCTYQCLGLPSHGPLGGSQVVSFSRVVGVHQPPTCLSGERVVGVHQPPSCLSGESQSLSTVPPAHPQLGFTSSSTPHGWENVTALCRFGKVPLKEGLKEDFCYHAKNRLSIIKLKFVLELLGGLRKMYRLIIRLCLNMSDKFNEIYSCWHKHNSASI